MVLWQYQQSLTKPSQAMRRSNSIGGITERSRGQTSARQHNKKPYPEIRPRRETSFSRPTQDISNHLESNQLLCQNSTSDLTPRMKKLKTVSRPENDISSMLKRRLTIEPHYLLLSSTECSNDSDSQFQQNLQFGDNILKEIRDCSNRKPCSLNSTKGGDHLAAGESSHVNARFHQARTINKQTETTSAGYFIENTPPGNDSDEKVSYKAHEMSHKYQQKKPTVEKLVLDEIPKLDDTMKGCAKEERPRVDLSLKRPPLDCGLECGMSLSPLTLSLQRQIPENSPRDSHCQNIEVITSESINTNPVKRDFNSHKLKFSKIPQDVKVFDNEEEYFTIRYEDNDDKFEDNSIHAPSFKDEFGAARSELPQEGLHENNMERTDKTDADEMRSRTVMEQSALHNVSSLRRQDTLVLQQVTDDDALDYNDEDYDDDAYLDLFECCKNILCQKIPDDNICDSEDLHDENIEDTALPNNSKSFKNLLSHPARFLCAVCSSHLEIPYFQHLDKGFQDDDFPSFHRHNGNMPVEELYCPRCCCWRNLYHPR